MRNSITIDGKTFQGHMDIGGNYEAASQGSLTSATPTATITMPTTCFVNIQVFMSGNATAYAAAYVDDVACGYVSAYTIDNNWSCLSFPMRQGQVLKLTAYGLAAGQTWYYLVHKMYYKQD